MKRTALILIVLLTATSLLAGGKECEAKAAKNVTLTGSISSTGSGDEAKAVFRVAGKDLTYTICEETRTEFRKLSGNVKVKGKVVNCGGNEELVITHAQKI